MDGTEPPQQVSNSEANVPVPMDTERAPVDVKTESMVPQVSMEVETQGDGSDSESDATVDKENNDTANLPVAVVEDSAVEQSAQMEMKIVVEDEKEAKVDPEPASRPTDESSSSSSSSSVPSTVSCDWDNRATIFQAELDALLEEDLKFLNLREHPETKAQLEKFQKAIEGSDDDEYPEAYISLLAKICQDSDESLTQLSKRVFKILLPGDTDSEITLLTIGDAINKACERKSYGIKGSKIVTSEDTSSTALWRWETVVLESVPADVQGKLKDLRKERRQTLKRVNAYAKFFALKKRNNVDDVKLSMAADKIVKFNREASIAKQKAVLKAEKEQKRKQREANKVNGKSKAEKAKEKAAKDATKKKKAAELEKKKKEESQAKKKAEKDKKQAELKQKKEEAALLKEKAKQEKEEAKRLKEEAAKKEQEKLKKKLQKQQGFFSSFKKKSPKKVKPVEGPATRFVAWETPKDTKLAPVLVFKTSLKKSELDAQYFSNTTPPQEFAATLKPLRKRRTPGGKKKLLQFCEDVRPNWHGRHQLMSSKNVTGRKPFGSDTQLDYEVDSEAEWEDEGDGEELRSDEEEDHDEDGDSGHARGDGLEEDGWLIAEDDPEFDGGLTEETKGAKIRIFGPEFDENALTGDAGNFLKRFTGVALTMLPLDCVLKEPVEAPPSKPKSPKPVKEKKEKKKEASESGKGAYSQEELDKIMQATAEFSNSRGMVKWATLFAKYTFGSRSQNAIKGKYFQLKQLKAAAAAQPGAGQPQSTPTPTPSEPVSAAATVVSKTLAVAPMNIDVSSSSSVAAPTIVAPKPEKVAEKSQAAVPVSAKYAESSQQVASSPSTKTPTPSNRKRKSTTPPDTKGKAAKRVTKTKKSPDKKKTYTTIKSLFSKQLSKKPKQQKNLDSSSTSTNAERPPKQAEVVDLC